MSRALQDRLRDRREEILLLWETLVADEADGVRTGMLAFRESIPAFLAGIAEWLESGEETWRATEAVAGIVARLDGLDLAQAVRGYGLLRRAILRVLVDPDLGRSVPKGRVDKATPVARASELARLTAGLDDGLSHMVTQFVTERDRRARDERARSDAIVRENQATIESLYESASFLMGVAELDGDRILAVSGNRAAATFFSSQPEDLPGRPSRELRVPPDIDRLWLENYRRAQRERAPVRFEYEHPRGGGAVWLAATVAFIGVGLSNNPRFSFVAEDVTDRKRSERALREAEQRFRAMADGTPIMIWSTDARGRIEFVNRAYCEFFGVSQQDLATRGWEPLVHPEDAPAYVAAFTEALAARTFFRAEARVQRVDGAWRWVESFGQPRFSDAGDFLGVTGSSPDVTDRKEAEHAARASEERLAAVVEQLPIAVAVLGMDGRVVVGNSALRSFEIARPPSLDPEQRHRWSARDEQGRPLPPEQWPGARALRGEPVTPGVKFVHRRKDGHTVHAIVTAVPLRDADDRQTGAISVIQDVTALVEAEAELRRADRQKTDFLAVLSHELRNPLAPIRNSLYLLERAAPDTEQAARARVVLLRQTEHLTRLVDDLLDINRITRGKTELRRERLDLRDVVRRTTDDLRSIFDQNAIEFRVDQPVGPVWVDGDATRLAQVLGNLLQNAAKFTPSGGSVAVRVRELDRRATLSVRDTGAGMEPGQEDRMFEPFAQGAQGLARTRGGLGLGLALVRGLVELHGGSVRAASEGAGRGSEFVVTLPLADPPAASAGPSSRGAVPCRSVVIVEDNADAAQTLADILAMSGHRVRVARDGRSGLELVRQLKPDVILCDVGLPDIDGYEFAKLASKDPAVGRPLLVAVTGYAQPEDRERALRAGFDAHLPKPPPVRELEDLLRAGRPQTNA